MKKSVLPLALFAAIPTSFSFAADLPVVKGPIETAVVMPIWTGFYAGLNAGSTWSNTSSFNTQTWNLYPAPDNISYTSAAHLSGSNLNSGNIGFIGGGQFGYNWRVAAAGMNFLAGFEADIQGVAGGDDNSNHWTSAPMDMVGVPYSLLSNQKVNGRISYLGTVRGRLGYLVMSNLLIYGTGGLAYGGVNATVRNAQLWTGGATVIGQDYLNSGSSSYSNTQVGWTAGGGFEWMFMPNWSAKAEYLYYDLCKVTGSVVNNYYALNRAPGGNGIESVTNYSGRASGNIARLGVNYHFNWGAAPAVVAAKY